MGIERTGSFYGEMRRERSSSICICSYELALCTFDKPLSNYGEALLIIASLTFIILLSASTAFLLRQFLHEFRRDHDMFVTTTAVRQLRSSIAI